MANPTSKKFERLGMKITLTDGVAEVVHYKDARCVTVKFIETGTEVTTTWQNISNGNVRDNKTVYTSPTQHYLHTEYQRLRRNNVNIWKSEHDFFEWAYDRLPEDAMPRLIQHDGVYYLVPEDLDLNYTVTIAVESDVENMEQLRIDMVNYVATLEKRLCNKHNRVLREYYVQKHLNFITSFFDINE